MAGYGFSCAVKAMISCRGHCSGGKDPFAYHPFRYQSAKTWQSVLVSISRRSLRVKQTHKTVLLGDINDNRNMFTLLQTLQTEAHIGLECFSVSGL